MKTKNRLSILTLSTCLVAGCGGSNGTPDPDPPPDGPEVPVELGLELVADGFTAPVALVPVPDDTGRLFVVDQVGLIHVLTADGERLSEPFLDVTARMLTLRETYDESGLLGLAFHPQYVDNGRFYVYYSAPLRAEGPQGWSHTNRVSEFMVSADDPDQADDGSERVVLAVDQPQRNHNAGTLLFGPEDGLLYISLGDGGGSYDTGFGHTDDLGNAQDTSNLLGSILRIDVDVNGAEPYAIPPDNPFADDAQRRPEIFAYGLRNPYRMAFDQGGSHSLFAADAGQELWEAVYLIELGGNFGWNIKEGSACFDPATPEVSPAQCPDVGAGGEPLIDPVIEYPNIKQTDGIGIVVIGGHVYRGSAMPGLVGHYVFGDWSGSPGVGDGLLFVADPGAEPPWPIEDLTFPERPGGALGRYLLAFGEDRDGELYVLTSDRNRPTGDTGRVYRLVPLD